MTLIPMMHCAGRRVGGSQRAGWGRWDLCCWSTLALGGTLGVSDAELFWGVGADAGSGVHQGILLWEQVLEACPCSAVVG